MFICNKCKKVFPDLDGYGMRIQYTFGYGSKRDDDLFDLTVCNECADDIADAVAKICAVNPIVCIDYDALYGDDFAEPDDDSDGDANIFS